MMVIVKDGMGGVCSTHEEVSTAYKFWSGNLKGRNHLEDLGVDGRILLEWIFGNRVGGCGMDSSGSG
jgi:hypothetical protein